MQSGAQTDVIVMDFSKTFDKIRHSKLIHKLQHYVPCHSYNKKQNCQQYPIHASWINTWNCFTGKLIRTGYITITSDLWWNAHINNKISLNAKISLGFLRRNLKIPSIQTQTQAFFAFVKPILENSCTVCDSGLHL